MLSTLISVIESQDINGRAFFTCQFRQENTTLTNEDTSYFEQDGIFIINPKAAAAHDRVVTFNIFENESMQGKAIAATLRSLIEQGDDEKLKKIKLPLVYVEIPVNDVFPGKTCIYMQRKDGSTVCRSTFGVTGYSKVEYLYENGKLVGMNDTDVWDASLMNNRTPLEFAKENALRQISDGLFSFSQPSGENDILADVSENVSNVAETLNKPNSSQQELIKTAQAFL